MTRARDVANLIGSGNYSSTTFTATAGQTAFTISHTQGFIQVFMNGLLLDETVDYTSNGSAVTLTSGAAAGDEIEVVKYNTFSVGDAVAASGGTFTGNVTMSGTLGVTGNVTHTGTTTANNDIIANKHVRLYRTNDQASQWYFYNHTDNSLRFNYNGAGNDEIVITSSGHVTMPNQPFVRLSLTSHFRANTNVSDPGDHIAGVFTVRENVGNHWSSSNNNFTCPVAGVYTVSVFYIKYPSSGKWAAVDLHKNGSIVDNIRWRAPEINGGYHQAGGTASVTCAANDVLDWHYVGTAGLHSQNGSWEIMLSH